jgi:hypothetical protein
MQRKSSLLQSSFGIPRSQTIEKSAPFAKPLRLCVKLSSCDLSDASRKLHYSDEVPRFLQCSVKSSLLQSSFGIPRNQTIEKSAPFAKPSRLCVKLSSCDHSDASRKLHYSDEVPRFLQCSVNRRFCRGHLEYRGIKPLKNLRPLRNLRAFA